MKKKDFFLGQPRSLGNKKFLWPGLLAGFWRVISNPENWFSWRNGHLVEKFYYGSKPKPNWDSFGHKGFFQVLGHILAGDFKFGGFISTRYHTPRCWFGRHAQSLQGSNRGEYRGLGALPAGVSNLHT